MISLNDLLFNPEKVDEFLVDFDCHESDKSAILNLLKNCSQDLTVRLCCSSSMKEAPRDNLKASANTNDPVADHIIKVLAKIIDSYD